MGRITLRQFNQGGIAPSKYEGRANSVAEMVGINIHDIPGVFFANFALTKETSTTIDSFVKEILVCSNDKVYAFSSTTGKVWERATNGTWSLVHTTTPAAGGAGCLGAAEYNGYIYWATESRLHRIAVADTGDWAANAVEDYQTFAQTDSEFHPMLVMDNRLYIGDGSNLCQLRYDGASYQFTAEALRIYPPQRIKCLGKLDFDILIGSIVDNFVNKSTIYRWNRYSDSWNVEDEIEEVGINAFIPMDNNVLVSAGVNGNIYAYGGQVLELAYQIPGDYDSSNKAIVHPDATAYFNGKPVFGLSTSSGTPTKMGVYSLATKNPQLYPRVLNLEYVISQDKVNTIEIGSVSVRGNDLFVSWKDGTTYGVDKISSTTRYDGAYFVSRVMTVDRNLEDNFEKIYAAYASLPESCDIEIYIKRSHEASWPAEPINLVDEEDLKQMVCDEIEQGINYQLKVVLRTSGANTPIVESVNIDVNTE